MNFIETKATFSVLLLNSNNHSIGTYCGFQTGRSVLTTGSAAVLSFHSDGSFQYGGFDLSFSFFPLGELCSKRAHEEVH